MRRGSKIIIAVIAAALTYGTLATVTGRGNYYPYRWYGYHNGWHHANGCDGNNCIHGQPPVNNNQSLKDTINSNNQY
jgi:hypothetical protein